TAACCIIGDEILSGKIRDTNTQTLAQFLFKLGIPLKTIHTVGDDEDAIIESVRTLYQHHTFVFTSGGIGPTHDDITYAAIAKAFNLSLRVDKDTEQRLKVLNHTSNLLKSYQRMATFPFPALLVREDPSLPIPIVMVMEKVFILPGIPRLFQHLILSLQSYLERILISRGESCIGFTRMEVTTHQPEAKLAAYLAHLQTIHPKEQIMIGSYPEEDRVVVSIVGKDKTIVAKVAQDIEQTLQAK
ncbi:MoaB/Mog domain-containing protein, partial [Spinellus fusiger]